MGGLDLIAGVGGKMFDFGELTGGFGEEEKEVKKALKNVDQEMVGTELGENGGELTVLLFILIRNILQSI